MEKLVHTSSFYNQSDLDLMVIDLGSPKSGFVKRAADNAVKDYISKLIPKEGKIYLHINAMGAGEYYGSNRNGDYFPEEVLKKYYKTFETSPAHVYRHHINKDPAKSIGVVLFSIYNERMHRVELIAEVDKSLGKDIEDRLAAGDFPSTSMACKTPYDECSICGHQARTREDYCTHIKNSLNTLMPDGRKVMALNIAPLKFFDISIIIRPADVTSLVMQKVASHGFGEEISSAYAAEEEGLSYSLNKRASIQKLSELIKEVTDGYVVSIPPTARTILDKVSDPSIDKIPHIVSKPVNRILSSFAELGVSPSVSYLAEILCQKHLGDEGVGLGHVVKKVLDSSDITLDQIPSVEDMEYSPDEHVIRVYSSDMDSSSLFPSYVEKRAYMTEYDVISNALWRNSGHRHLGSEADFYKSIKKEEDNGSKGNMMKLLQVGLAALAAKWFITSKIAEQERRLISRQDARIAYGLAKHAMALEVTYKDPSTQSSSYNSLTNTAKKLSSIPLREAIRATPIGKEALLAMRAKRLYDKVMNSNNTVV